MEGINAIIALLGALILASILIPLGMVYTSIASLFRIKFKTFGVYWIKFFKEVWLVFTRAYYQVTLAIDYLGNVTCGPMIINIITKKGWFKKHRSKLICGESEVTLSSAIGQAEYHGAISPNFRWVITGLNKAFNEEAHALDSYLKTIQTDCNCK